MSNIYQPPQNSSTAGVIEELLELKVFFSFAPWLIFLYINCVMLYTLRSKIVFRETSRYLLLYNLLLVETLQMALSQLIYLLAVGQVLMTSIMCLLIILLTILNTTISPLNLAVMSLERYVAVCFPLMYGNIVTVTSTYGAIAVVWAICFAGILVRVLMLVALDRRPFDQSMSIVCTKVNIFQYKIFGEFENGFVFAQFGLVGLILIFSYVGVIVVAKSASTDKASGVKARKTIMLHMIQLGLSLSTTLVPIILIGASEKVDWVTFKFLRFAMFVCFNNLPRCLSSLIYGLRDQNIRPILMEHLRLGSKWPNVQVSHLRCKLKC